MFKCSIDHSVCITLHCLQVRLEAAPPVENVSISANTKQSEANIKVLAIVQCTGNCTMAMYITSTLLIVSCPPFSHFLSLPYASPSPSLSQSLTLAPSSSPVQLRVHSGNKDPSRRRSGEVVPYVQVHVRVY